MSSQQPCYAESQAAFVCLQLGRNDCSCFDLDSFLSDFPVSIEKQFTSTLAFVPPSDPGFCDAANKRACDYYLANESCCCQEETSRFRTCYVNTVVSQQIPLDGLCKENCNLQGDNGTGKEKEGANGGTVFFIVILVLFILGGGGYHYFRRHRAAIGDIPDNKADNVEAIPNIDDIEENDSGETKIWKQMATLLSKTNKSVYHRLNNLRTRILAKESEATKGVSNNGSPSDMERGSDDDPSFSSSDYNSSMSEESDFATQRRQGVSPRELTCIPESTEDDSIFSSSSLSSAFSSTDDEADTDIINPRGALRPNESDAHARPRLSELDSATEELSLKISKYEEHLGSGSSPPSSAEVKSLAKDYPAANTRLKNLEMEREYFQNKLQSTEEESFQLRQARDQQNRRIVELETQNAHLNQNQQRQQQPEHIISVPASTSNSSDISSKSQKQPTCRRSNTSTASSEFLRAHQALRGSGSLASSSKGKSQKSSQGNKVKTPQAIHKVNDDKRLTRPDSKLVELCTTWHHEPRPFSRESSYACQ